jgi:hypothetical protein
MHFMFGGCYGVFQIKGRQQIGREACLEYTSHPPKKEGVRGIFVLSSKKL